MNGSDELKRDALSAVEKLLNRRLARGKVTAVPAGAYYQLEAEEAAVRRSGYQVRVKTWRHWSNASVKLDADTGEFLGYSIARYADPPTEAGLEDAEALAAVAAAIEIPGEAVLDSIQTLEYAPRRRLLVLQWLHVHRGLRVDGDYLRVVLHPVTRRVVEVERYWREVKLRP